MTAAYVSAITNPTPPSHSQAGVPRPATSASPTASPVSPPPAPPSPSPHPSPSPSPKRAAPVADPHQLTANNVKQSILDNQSFAAGAKFDALQVAIAGGEVDVTGKPAQVFDEQGIFTTGAADTLVVAKAVFGYYPDAKLIIVTTQTDFTDTYGKSSTEAATVATISDVTAAKFDYDGVNSRIFDHPDILYCDADGYNIHPAVWKNVKTKDCMVDGPTKVAP